MASDLFSIGSSGLKAARAGLEVTSQNIANAATEGYVRRSVSLSEMAAAGGYSRLGDLSLSGVRVARYKLLVYALSGFTAAVAGIVQASRVTSGQPGVGVGFELDAIAAVVMGGTSIAGGRGAIVGTLVGALLLGVLNNGLNMIGVSPYLQLIIKGGIVLLAIFISREAKR